MLMRMTFVFKNNHTDKETASSDNQVQPETSATSVLKATSFRLWSKIEWC